MKFEREIPADFKVTIGNPPFAIFDKNGITALEENGTAKFAVALLEHFFNLPKRDDKTPWQG